MLRLPFHGRVTKDFELKKTAGGVSTVRFSLACDRYAGATKGNVTEYPNFIAYGKNAETLAKYVKKGSELVIEAEFTSWKRQVDGEQNPRTIVEFDVKEFQFCGSKKTDDGVQAPAQPPPQQQPQSPPPSAGNPEDFDDLDGDDEDLPF